MDRLDRFHSHPDTDGDHDETMADGAVEESMNDESVMSETSE